MNSPTRTLIVSALLAVLSLSGCQTFKESASTAFHNLKPHRLWRLNRQPAPRRDVYYSVSDPIPGLIDSNFSDLRDSADRSRTEPAPLASGQSGDHQ